MNRIPLLMLLLAPWTQALAQDRWVQATSLMLRAEASPTAPILARLQQGSRVRLVTPNVGGGDWCMVEAGTQLAFVACRYLSEQPVALPRAGEGGVPADRRWVAGSNLLMRAEPRPDAAVLSRLSLNTMLRLTGDEAGSNGYCAVQRVDGDVQSGYTACRYLQRSPLEMDKLTEPWKDGRNNPDFDPARAFWIAPSWELMSHYASHVERQRQAKGNAAPTGPDEQLERMKARLSGQVAHVREPATVWPDWEQLRDPKSGDPAASLNLWGEIFSNEHASRPAAFIRALPALPAVTPSWWRSEAELAGPGESIPALATRFGGEVVWLHESLLPGARRPREMEAGIRVERLTQPLQRISLMSNQSLREERRQPETMSTSWDPNSETGCAAWQGAFSFGDADAATYKRNQFEQPARSGPLTLFRLWSTKPLPAGPARWTSQAFKLDRDKTGFVSAEWRVVDLDGDGVPDLAWLQATGRGPGHLDGSLKHDDPWYRLLLANVAGHWRLLDVDLFSYGCGC
ncbi:SH3 domain-containing protein [Roseateles sp. NT4]|uniref:SH3 domain-containing protein n=1 Tax=Roseateles sp. NT4 TaxID=3453715 RepID=UPI003EEC2B00